MRTPVQVMQVTLAGEHAAVHVLGLVGGRVSASRQADLAERVRSAYTLHRARRDQLTAMLRQAGAAPVAAEVSYRPATPARTPAQLREAARVVEERCAAVYADMVGGTSGAGRQWALDALEDAAVRALGLGAQPEAFPGLGEL
jgi:hypothetical protein